MASLYKKEIARIEESLSVALENVNGNDKHQKYLAHKVAFNEIMEIVKASRPLLNQIKSEYESLIFHVSNAQNFSKVMEEEIQAASSYPTTIQNYKRLCIDLREKLQVLRRSNNHKLEKVRDIKMKYDTVNRQLNAEIDETKVDKITIRKELRKLPNMNLAKLTDLTTMQNLCSQLETQKVQLLHTLETKYVPKDEEIQLIEQLTKQVEKHDQTRNDVHHLIRRKILLQAALTQARLFQESHPFHQSIGEVLARVLAETSKLIDSEKFEDLSIEEKINSFFPDFNRPAGSLKESEYIVLSIRKFEKLFNDGKFKEAANLAVVTPRGVLRNYATLLKFKDAGSSHLLHYCQQLIETAKEGSVDADMGFECADIALKEGRIDLVNLWISKCRIPPTQLLADNLTCYADLIPENKIACLDLAASVYRRLLNDLMNAGNSERDSRWLSARNKYFDNILECCIKCGRIEEAIEMLTNANGGPVSARSLATMYSEDDYLLLIQYYPTMELIQNLMEKNFLSSQNVIKYLLDKNMFGVLCDVLIGLLSKFNDVSDLVDMLTKNVPTAITADAWEAMLNYVDKTKEKLVIEIAATYLVQLSIENSCRYLMEIGLFDS